jgi:hypothetical protein
MDHRANRQRMADYLDAVAAVGLLEPSDVPSHLTGGDDFGQASLLLETTFDADAMRQLFGLAGTGQNQDLYEEVGRQALLAVVDAGDADSYRRIPASRADLWKRMKDAGQPSFAFVLPPPITGSDSTIEALRVAVVAADYSAIVWWAAAMAQAAERLTEMQTFLGGRKAVDLVGDAQFEKRRKDLEHAMVKAVGRNTSSFGDPWGLVALYLASARKATAAATIVSPKLTLFLPN